jgi:hypothetical protein
MIAAIHIDGHTFTEIEQALDARWARVRGVLAIPPRRAR